MQTGYRCVVNTLGKHWIMCITLMLFVKLRPLVTLYLFLFLLQQMLFVANVFFRCVFSRCLFRLFVTIFIFPSFPAAVCHHENNDPFPFADDYLFKNVGILENILTFDLDGKHFKLGNNIVTRC